VVSKFAFKCKCNLYRYVQVTSHADARQRERARAEAVAEELAELKEKYAHLDLEHAALSERHRQHREQSDTLGDAIARALRTGWGAARWNQVDS
jgi:predicted  nucleic acid-binding Zn-ribbon protein